MKEQKPINETVVLDDELMKQLYGGESGNTYEDPPIELPPPTVNNEMD